jgi:hypothetical protein
MALKYLGMAVALKLQKSNEKYRLLGKMSIFLQDRLKWSWSGVTILRKIDRDAARWSLICYWGHLHIHIPSGMGSRCHSFSLCFVSLDFNLPQLDGFEEFEAEVRCVSWKGQMNVNLWWAIRSSAGLSRHSTKQKVRCWAAKRLRA